MHLDRLREELKTDTCQPMAVRQKLTKPGGGTTTITITESDDGSVTWKLGTSGVSWTSTPDMTPAQLFLQRLVADLGGSVTLG